MKRQFQCQQCAHTLGQWQGQCPGCLTWNTLEEISVKKSNHAINKKVGYAGESAQVVALKDIEVINTPRTETGSKELDRVLGGGLVPGSVVLIGGDPGIGKSTLLLQTLCHLSQSAQTLYVSGEESLAQIALRAKRLQLKAESLQLVAETQIEAIAHLCSQKKPQVLVIDSIQTIYSESLSAAPGSVSQVRESTALLVRLAKASGISIFIIGHVTKEGALAGPRVLEHMVDSVLYFEGQKDSRFRLIRAFKNRYGAANELGVFAMTDTGLKGVNNPSALFLTRHESNLSGSVIYAGFEGSRPLLIEVQALVDDNHGGNARRLTQGVDTQRLNLLLAVLNRHGEVPTYDKDIFINLVGGVKMSETGIDLAMLAAIISSLKDKALDPRLVIFGEVGLSGEVRPVQSGSERINEAIKHGFKKAVIPKANCPKSKPDGIKLYPVNTLAEMIDLLREEMLLSE